MYKPLNMFTSQTDELKKLIAEHPDCPIAVVVNGEVCCDDTYRWWYAPSLSFDMGEILDCEQDIDDEKVYVDRDEFREDVEYRLTCDDAFSDMTDNEFDAAVNSKLAEYEPYWKIVILIKADV